MILFGLFQSFSKKLFVLVNKDKKQKWEEEFTMQYIAMQSGKNLVDYVVGREGCGI